MNALVQQFDADMRLRDLSDMTRAQYTNCVAVFLRSDVQVDTLSGADIRAFLMRLLDTGRTPATVRLYGAAIKRWVRYTLEQPELVANLSLPQKRVTPPRPPLSPEELAALLRACHGDALDYTLVSLLVGTGLRIAEAMRVQTGDIDGKTGALLVRNGKGGKQRVVPLTRRLLAILRRYWVVARPPGPWLFPAVRRGQHRHLPAPDCFAAHPRSAATARKRIVRRGEQAGLPRRVLPHDLRRTFATTLLEAGTDMALVQRLLGHRNIETTARYAQVRQRTLDGLRDTLEHVHRALAHR